MSSRTRLSSSDRRACARPAHCRDRTHPPSSLSPPRLSPPATASTGCAVRDPQIPIDRARPKQRPFCPRFPPWGDRESRDVLKTCVASEACVSTAALVSRQCPNHGKAQLKREGPKFSAVGRSAYHAVENIDLADILGALSCSIPSGLCCRAHVSAAASMV